MKRFLLLFLFAVFLSVIACSPNQEPEVFAVAIYNLTDSDEFNPETNNTVTTLYFIVQNQEPFPLDCKVLLTMDNQTNTSKKLGRLGILESGSSKPGAFSFEMFEGESSISLEPVCEKAVVNEK